MSKLKALPPLSPDIEEAVRALRAQAATQRHTAEILAAESQRHYNEAARLIRIANSLAGGGGYHAETKL